MRFVRVLVRRLMAMRLHRRVLVREPDAASYYRDDDGHIHVLF